jgi:hypothetical protein
MNEDANRTLGLRKAFVVAQGFSQIFVESSITIQESNADIFQERGAA